MKGWLHTAKIEHPALWSEPQMRLYACPLADYQPEPCPTPFRREYVTPKCRTHDIVMRLVPEAAA